jgi:5-methylcytosine-specific restriction protein A
VVVTTAALRPCAADPHCPSLVGRGRPCPQHPLKGRGWAPRHRTDPRLRGYGAEWRRLRALILQRDPLCSCGAPATEVDHVRAKALGGNDDPSNLVGRCRTCHASKTGRDARMVQTR